MSISLPDPDDIALRLAANLGLNLTDDGDHSCQGHKGSLYFLGADGKKHPAVVVKRTGKPTVLDCEHEAFDIAYKLIMQVTFAAALGRLITGKESSANLPKPEDFFYVMAEDYAEDEVIEDTEEAEALLRTITSKL